MVNSAPDAPFKLGRLKGQVWVVDPNPTQEDQSAILLLSDADLPCAGVTDNVYRGLDRAIGEGRGVLFWLFQDDGYRQEQDLTWTGLWNSGYASSADQGRRGLYSAYFADGFLYTDNGYDNSSWLRIDEAGPDGVRGDFQMSGTWSGRFKAEHCGMWVELEDSGHDNAYNSDNAYNAYNACNGE